MSESTAQPADHWLVALAKQAPNHRAYPVGRSVQSQFVGAVVHIAENGTIDDVRTLVAAYKEANRIAAGRLFDDIIKADPTPAPSPEVPEPAEGVDMHLKVAQPITAAPETTTQE